MLSINTKQFFQSIHLIYSKSIFTFTTKTTKSSKTLYQILQLPSTSPQSNIRKNYLKLAKIFHPDVYKGSDKSRFEQIQKAYQILIDIRKRKQYDQQIGLKKKPKNQYNQFQTTATTEHVSDDQVNKRNSFTYDDNTSTEKTQEEAKINLDEEYQKFFKKKKQTDFEQIRLHQQAQFREMNEKQRVRFRFRQLYTNDAAQMKIQNTKAFQSLLDDQIDQRNTHYSDVKKKKEKIQKLNSQESIKRQKLLVYGLTVVGAMIFYPLLISFWTKYRLEREQEYRIKQIMDEIRIKQQEADIRSRFQY